MKLRLTADEHDQFKKRPTDDALACEHHLKGRFHWNKRTEAEEQLAIRLFEKAFEIDPEYALAYSGLSDAYAVIGPFGFLPPRDTWPKAKAAAMKALDLDDHIGEAHASLGYLKCVYDLDWSGAEVEFRRAMQLDPLSVQIAVGLVGTYNHAHQYERALEALRNVAELDSNFARINLSLGVAFVGKGNYSDAIPYLQDAATRHVPSGGTSALAMPGYT